MRRIIFGLALLLLTALLVADNAVRQPQIYSARLPERRQRPAAASKRMEASTAPLRKRRLSSAVASKERPLTPLANSSLLRLQASDFDSLGVPGIFAGIQIVLNL